MVVDRIGLSEFVGQRVLRAEWVGRTDDTLGPLVDGVQLIPSTSLLLILERHCLLVSPASVRAVSPEGALRRRVRAWAETGQSAMLDLPGGPSLQAIWTDDCDAVLQLSDGRMLLLHHGLPLSMWTGLIKDPRFDMVPVEASLLSADEALAWREDPDLREFRSSVNEVEVYGNADGLTSEAVHYARWRRESNGAI